MGETEETKGCGWAKFVAGKTADCQHCPFEKCINDIFDDAVEEFWRIFNAAYQKARK